MWTVLWLDNWVNMDNNLILHDKLNQWHRHSSASFSSEHIEAGYDMHFSFIPRTNQKRSMIYGKMVIPIFSIWMHDIWRAMQLKNAWFCLFICSECGELTDDFRRDIRTKNASKLDSQRISNILTFPTFPILCHTLQLVFKPATETNNQIENEIITPDILVLIAPKRTITYAWLRRQSSKNHSDFHWTLQSSVLTVY